MGSEGAAEDTVKPGSRGNKSLRAATRVPSWGASSAFTPRLQSSALQPDRGGYNAAILPR